MAELLTLPGGAIGWRDSILALLLAFVLSMWVGGLYAWTYRGLSYSRRMVQSLVIAGVVASILMLAIGDNLTRGLGIIGTLALIRFRTNLRDPWDMVFVFSVFAVGIAAGTRAYSVAIMGTLVLSASVVFLSFSRFGGRQEYDGLLRLQLDATPEAQSQLRAVLEAHCRTFVLVTLREVKQGAAQEHAYQVRLWSPKQQPQLVSDVMSLAGARTVTLHMQEATVEL